MGVVPMFILDMGSGNTCKNDYKYIEKMIDAVAEEDKERKCILKWQLFESAGANVVLKNISFQYAYAYAKRYGFKTTASVFDIPSLNFLLNHEIPFVKIANNPELYYLIGKVPREIPVIKSIGGLSYYGKTYNENVIHLYCVSEYPAKPSEYKEKFGGLLKYGLSDHTEDWRLYNTFKSGYYECHFKLDDSTGLDAGSFARTPEELREVLI